MKLMTWLQEKVRNFTLWDITIFKLALVIFGIIIGAYIANYVQENLMYFIVAFVILYGYLLYRMFK